ncbi:MAG: serine acetyltransferase [Bacteroidales bacterium]|nr:serine acetyltransferase [Bacteroidales bacterium]
MIQSKKDLQIYIREDKKINLGTYKIGTLKYIAKCIYGSDNIKAYRLLKSLRKLEYSKNCLYSKGILGKVIYYIRKFKYHKLSERYNINIGVNMIGYGFRIPHVIGGGIVINCDTMGNYCSANIGVVIGNNHSLTDRPIIGDNVSFTTGSKAYGNIYIGNNVTVAPNSVCTKDVPDNCIVSGIPAKIIKYKDNE